jgi:lipopolysaccharide/colanic/teichoic acid biosynthesis glycosyltransferase
MVTDLNVSEFTGDQRLSQGHITLARSFSGTIDKELQRATAEEMKELDVYPLFVPGPALALLTTSGATAPGWPDREQITVDAYRASCSCERIKSLADLIRVNRLVLDGRFQAVIIPGKSMKSGIWVGRHCRIHPRAKLEPPLIIGNNCNIQGGSSIGPGSVIGDDVIIDECASVKDSLVLDRTYVGPCTQITDAIVRKNWIFKAPGMLNVYLGDDLILGDLEKRTLTTKAGRFLDLLLAFMLLFLTSPLWVFLLVYHLIFPSKKFFFSEKRLGTCAQMSLGGEKSPRHFDLFLFNSTNGLIRKLPGLMNVIRGDLNLVGVATLTDEERDELPEDWKEAGDNAPFGLFHLWELERRSDLEWWEKMAMDSYYAATRTTWGDLKILGKVLIANLLD